MTTIRHIAIIMDGNGRWAEKQGKKRIKGHERGAETVREITTHCAKIGIPFLTLYAFSTENWKRPKAEVEFLMKLLSRYLKNEIDVYQENGIRFKMIGERSGFSNSLQKQITATEEATRSNEKMTQILALNYGSKNEIIRACESLRQHDLPCTEENLEQHLDTAFAPPVDLLIRTGGEQRISNFLLWQSAYAEFWFCEKQWPDFTAEDIDAAIVDFHRRERRFGGLESSPEGAS